MKLLIWAMIWDDLAVSIKLNPPPFFLALSFWYMCICAYLMSVLLHYIYLHIFIILFSPFFFHLLAPTSFIRLQFSFFRILNSVIICFLPIIFCRKILVILKYSQSCSYFKHKMFLLSDLGDNFKLLTIPLFRYGSI